MHGYEVIEMIADENYNYYPEAITQIMVQHELILPHESHDFIKFV